MSYILDALRRAERERNLGEVPDLRAGHPTPAPARRKLWGWLLATALTINVVGILLLIQHSGKDAPPSGSSSDSVPANEASDASAGPSTTGQPAAATPEPAPASASNAPVAVSESATPAAGGLAPDSMSPESARLAPLLTSLPQDFVRSVPELTLDVHVYSDDRVQRFVVINSRHYREGDYTHEGPVLDAITRDGAILSYRGQRFLVPVYR